MTSKDQGTKLRLFTDQSYFGQYYVLIFSSFQKTFPTRLCIRTPVEVNAIWDFTVYNQLLLPTHSNNPKMTSIHD